MEHHPTPVFVTVTLLAAAAPAAAGIEFSSEATIETVAAVADLVLADLDGDGDLDIAVLEGAFGFPAPATVEVLLNHGDGSFASGPPREGDRPLMDQHAETVDGRVMMYDVFDIGPYRTILTSSKEISFATCNCKGFHILTKCKHIHYALLKKGESTPHGLANTNRKQDGKI